MEWLVAAGAIVCAGPVVFGFIVTRWVKYWSRESRGGAIVPARLRADVAFDPVRHEFEQDCG